MDVASNPEFLQMAKVVRHGQNCTVSRTMRTLKEFEQHFVAQVSLNQKGRGCHSFLHRQIVSTADELTEVVLCRRRLVRSSDLSGVSAAAPGGLFELSANRRALGFLGVLQNGA